MVNIAIEKCTVHIITLDTAHTIWCSSTDHAYPLTFTSLQWGVQRNTSMLIVMSPSYVNGCEKPSSKQKHSPHQRLKDRSDTMTERLMPFHWRQVTWSWLKLTPTRGRGKWRTGGKENCMKWNTMLLTGSLHTLWRTNGLDIHRSSTETDFT